MRLYACQVMVRVNETHVGVAAEKHHGISQNVKDKPAFAGLWPQFRKCNWFSGGMDDRPSPTGRIC